MKVSSSIGGSLNLHQPTLDKRMARRGETRVGRQRQLLSFAACAIAGLISKSAIAASGTWTGATDATWAGNNWTATPVPGIADTATFNGLGGGRTTIDLGSGVTVNKIVFDSINTAAYTIGNGSIGSQTLSLNTSGGITMNSTVAANELFNAGLVLGTNANAATYTITNNSPSSLTFASNISGESAAGTGSLQTLLVGGSGNTVIGGSLLLGSQSNTSNVALTKIGSGTLTFNGTTNAAVIGNVPSGGAYGTVAVNAGTLVLDYSNYSAVGNANLLNSFTPVSLGGGTLQLIGNAFNASTQSFSSGSGVTVNPGLNVISEAANTASLTNPNPLPTLNLGAFTQNVGSMTVFNGPAYNSSATGATAVTVPATGTITTTTLGNQNNLLWPASRAGIATVGLYNWASVANAGSGSLSVLSGDQVNNFYVQVAAGGTAAAADTNYDLLGNATAASTTTWYTDTLRFNVQGAFNFNTTSAGANHITLVSGILVTPNVGANNTTIGNGGAYLASADGTAGNCPIDVYQNNTAGELLINVPLYYYTATSRATCFVKGGAGTVVLSGSGTNSANTGSPYLNGGCTVINADTQIGAAATAATLYLNGGTLVSSNTSNMTLGNGATANPRPITLLSNGGGLAAVAGTTLTVDGVIGSAANAGTLVIGIPASSANGNVAGLLPGTGAGTANTTPVYGTGTVALTFANGINGNYQYSPTLITAGATLQINSQFDLGGADASSLTFNNGTLQYSPTLATGAAGSALDISVQPVSFAGNATIDTNGHSVTYANSIGNGGSGLLTVLSTATGGSLTLAAASTYTGGTNITSGTLNVNNTTGSGTGSGLVTINGGTLGGSGIISGAVNLSSGAIAPGAAGTTLTLNALNYTSGNLSFSINGSAGTASQIAAGSATFNARPTFGAIAISGATGLTNNEVFTLLTSTSAIIGSSYLTGLTPQNAGRFTLTPSESGNSIILTASGYEANLVWQGGISDLGTGTAPKGDGSTWNDKQTTGASNFFNPNSNVNGYDFFYDLDNVTFNDTVVSPGTGSLSHIVNLASNVSPSSVTVATASTYTFFGTGSIIGLGNVLVSSGSLILENATNSYSGGTTITNNATLLTSVANVLPITGNVAVAGTFDLNSFNQSIGGLSDGGVSTGIVQSTGGAATLTTNAVGTPTFSGTLQNGTGTLSLVTSGTGTEILTGSNSFTGGTTINAGSTLQIGNNTSTISLPTGGSVTDNGNLAFNLSAGTIAVTNVISGTGTVTQSGPAGSILQLNNSNNYSGGTIIKSGTLQLTGATGIGTGDLTISSGAQFDLNSNSTSIGALNGPGLIYSSTGNGSTVMALSIGNNNDGGTFSGSINNSNGVVNLTKAGSGTQVFSGANNYTGTTTVSGGTLNVTGTLGTSGTPTGAITVYTAMLGISGNVYAPSLTTVNTGGYSAISMTAGSLTLTGNLAVNDDTNGAAVTGLTSLTGGTVSVNSVTIDRSSSNYGGNLQTLGSAGTGLYVNGATLAIATTLTFGDLGTRSFSSADMRIDSGSVTVGGTTIVTDNNNRLSLLDINGGTFTSNDTTGAGIQVGGLYAAGYGELLISGTGTLNTHTVTLGDTYQTTGGLNILEIIGGTSYIGSGGIVSGGGIGTNTINLGNATVATAPTIAASGDWTSSLPMNLSNSSVASGSLPVNFLAQSSAGVAHTITLTGALTGTGGITKSGLGTLYLSGSNTYGGGTNVSAGMLVLSSGTAFPSGTAQAGTTLTVGSGGAVQVANHGSNSTYVPIVSTLTNIGTIDLTNNAMIITNGSIGTINAQVAAAYNLGHWNGFSGSGAITSSLAAADTTYLTAVGVTTGLSNTFEGVGVSATDVLVKYTYYGDANLDGEVDGSDYSLIDNGALMGLTGWGNGDFNYDGVINGSDYTLIDNSFNTQGANIAAEVATPTAQIVGSGTSSAVPEPTTLGLLGLGAAGLLCRRRRR